MGHDKYTNHRLIKAMMINYKPTINIKWHRPKLIISREGISSTIIQKINPWLIKKVGEDTSDLIVKRKSYLDTDDRIDSFTSREGGFLYNNLILILMCFTIMWGTLFPILSEAWDGNKIYVGASYFNQLNIPIGLVLLFLMLSNLLFKIF